jgi:hypothetical protein
MDLGGDRRTAVPETRIVRMRREADAPLSGLPWTATRPTVTVPRRMTPCLNQSQYPSLAEPSLRAARRTLTRHALLPLLPYPMPREKGIQQARDERYLPSEPTCITGESHTPVAGRIETPSPRTFAGCPLVAGLALDTQASLFASAHARQACQEHGHGAGHPERLRFLSGHGP